MKTRRVSFVLAPCLVVSLCAGAAERHVANGLSSLPREAQSELWRQLAQLTASNGAPNDAFGGSISVSSDTVVVGAVDANGLGTAYVFVKSADGWSSMTQTARLNSSDEQMGDVFGNSVSIDGDTVVVGAPCAHPSQHCGRGAAYVFVKPANGWTDMTETAKLTALQGYQVGNSVSISGNTVVSGGGAAYVFVKPPVGWKDATETAKLTASDDPADGFRSVSIRGNEIVAGNPAKGNYAGSAYVFVEPNGGWKDMTQTAELTPSDGREGIYFGFSIAIDGSSAVIGAPGQFGPTSAAYVYVKPPNGWTDATETAKLTSYSGRKLFALSVAISGETIIAGQPYLRRKRGTAFVYVKPRVGGWRSTSRFNAKLTASSGKHEHYLGTAVAIDGNTVAVGAPNGGPYFPGSAYVFEKAK